MRATEFTTEAINWQGNLGNQQAAQTDHTIDEARQYVKSNYPKHKTYTVRRMEPGFRALDVKTGEHNDDAMRASNMQETAINQFVSIFKLKENTYMSGSAQFTTSIGYSWHVGEDADHTHAILYYEDRGMGSDSITIAAKTAADLAIMQEVLIDTGLIPDPAEVKAKRAATAKNRSDAAAKKGIKIGTRITIRRMDTNEICFAGDVTAITPNGVVEITIDQKDPAQQGPEIGEKYKMKPGTISKHMISNDN